MQPGQGKRGRFGVNNSVVAGVPFPSRARILPSPNLVSRVVSWRRDARTYTRNYWFKLTMMYLSKKVSKDQSS